MFTFVLYPFDFTGVWWNDEMGWYKVGLVYSWVIKRKHQIDFSSVCITRPCCYKSKLILKVQNEKWKFVERNHWCQPIVWIKLKFSLFWFLIRFSGAFGMKNRRKCQSSCFTKEYPLLFDYFFSRLDSWSLSRIVFHIYFHHQMSPLFITTAKWCSSSSKRPKSDTSHVTRLLIFYRLCGEEIIIRFGTQ